MSSRVSAVVPFVLCLLAMASSGHAQVATVTAQVETTPVPSSGDAADDMVVWVHPTDTGLSRVIGTDKHSGLLVYDLAGNQLQYLPDGDLNNVDLRYGFPLAGSDVALVTSGERSQNRLAIYAVDPTTYLLHDVAAGPIPMTFTVYGCCMYRSQVTGDTYFFGTSENGEVEQWRLFPTVAGTVDATLVRTLQLGSKTEGCVADDEFAYLYVSQEDVGIWRFGAEPGDVSPPVQVDTTGAGGHRTADVEGLAIYYAAWGAGYLLASSQGNSTFVAYDRSPPNAYRFSFQIGDNAALGIDGVSETDGIDVVNLALGSAFPSGAFLAQDGSNVGGNQNFKLVSWSDVAGAANPPLRVDTSYDALGVKAGTWSDLGGGTAGINGSPDLAGSGALVGGRQIALQLTQAPPSAFTLLWISIASAPLNVFGGTLHAIPFEAQYLFAADPLGELTLSTTWIPGIPSGTDVWFQYLVQDTSVLWGITLSNAVKATTP